jgi:hypothetical protein
MGSLGYPQGVDESAVDNPLITYNSLLSQDGTVPYLDNLSIHFLTGSDR